MISWLDGCSYLPCCLGKMLGKMPYSKMLSLSIGKTVNLWILFWHKRVVLRNKRYEGV